MNNNLILGLNTLLATWLKYTTTKAPWPNYLFFEPRLYIDFIFWIVLWSSVKLAIIKFWKRKFCNGNIRICQQAPKNKYNENKKSNLKQMCGKARMNRLHERTALLLL